jgi:hypothetical protein
LSLTRSLGGGSLLPLPIGSELVCSDRRRRELVSGPSRSPPLPVGRGRRLVWRFALGFDLLLFPVKERMYQP